MRENRPSGSEGGGAELNRSSLPLSLVAAESPPYSGYYLRPKPARCHFRTAVSWNFGVPRAYPLAIPGKAGISMLDTQGPRFVSRRIWLLRNRGSEMIVLVGCAVVIGAVIAGFVWSGGQVGALIHPAEIVTIGGAALGAMIVMSPKKVLVDLFRGLLQCLKGTPFN